MRNSSFDNFCCPVGQRIPKVASKMATLVENNIMWV